MKVTGIIAEYNPFHKGHAYQIREAKSLTGSDYCVVVMSPDFVQRGEAAVTDKYVRAEMALRGGADLVLELPVCFATGSARYFAEGAVRIFHLLGCIDFLCFGCEDPQLPLLTSLARVLYEEPEGYRIPLREALTQGLSFPAARERALVRCVGERDPEDEASESSAKKISRLLRSPNNILALEYLRALQLNDSAITPVPILRSGDAYHETMLSPGEAFPSAAALRRYLYDFEKASSDLFIGMGETKEADLRCALCAYLPSASVQTLLDALKKNGLPSKEVYNRLLFYRVLTIPDYSAYLDISEDLSQRIRTVSQTLCGGELLPALLQTKQFTMARIRRCLLHLFLGIREDLTQSLRAPGGAYTRILGFRSGAAPLLHRIKKEADLPVITKPADERRLLRGAALDGFHQDILASHLYHLLFPQAEPEGRENEYYHSPIIL